MLFLHASSTLDVFLKTLRYGTARGFSYTRQQSHRTVFDVRIAILAPWTANSLYKLPSVDWSCSKIIFRDVPVMTTYLESDASVISSNNWPGNF